MRCVLPWPKNFRTAFSTTEPPPRRSTKQGHVEVVCDDDDALCRAPGLVPHSGCGAPDSAFRRADQRHFRQSRRMRPGLAQEMQVAVGTATRTTATRASIRETSRRPVAQGFACPEEEMRPPTAGTNKKRSTGDHRSAWTGPLPMRRSRRTKHSCHSPVARPKACRCGSKARTLIAPSSAEFTTIATTASPSGRRREGARVRLPMAIVAV